jgi:CcmD family protein
MNQTTTNDPANNGPAVPEGRSTEFRAVQGGPEMASGETLLVEAYAAVWLILLAFVFVSWRRQSRIDARISELERALGAAARAGGSGK